MKSNIVALLSVLILIAIFFYAMRDTPQPIASQEDGIQLYRSSTAIYLQQNGIEVSPVLDRINEISDSLKLLYPTQ